MVPPRYLPKITQQVTVHTVTLRACGTGAVRTPEDVLKWHLNSEPEHLGLAAPSPWCRRARGLCGTAALLTRAVGALLRALASSLRARSYSLFSDSSFTAASQISSLLGLACRVTQ